MRTAVKIANASAGPAIRDSQDEHEAEERGEQDDAACRGCDRPCRVHAMKIRSRGAIGNLTAVPTHQPRRAYSNR